MEQIPRSLPQGIPAETARMKSAYNRGGLGTAAMYGVFQGIASMILVWGLLFVLPLKLIPRIDEIRGTAFSDPVSLLRDLDMLPPMLILLVIGQIIGFTAAIILMRKICPPAEPIQKKNLPIGRFLLIVLFAYGLWGVGIVIGNLPWIFGVEESSMLEELMKEAGWAAFPMTLYAVIGAPILEELAMRKVLLDRLHPYGEGFAMAASGLLFGLIHGNSGQFFLAFLLGMLFAMVYLRTGRIIYTILLHAIINLTASIPDFIQLAGPDISEVWMYVILGIGAVGFVVLLISHRDRILHPKGTFVPSARSAAWRNPGMIITRIAGLVLIGMNDLLTMTVSAVTDQSVAPLIRLIPLGLAIVTVLLLPGWTARFEKQVPDTGMADAANRV